MIIFVFLLRFAVRIAVVYRFASVVIPTINTNTLLKPLKLNKFQLFFILRCVLEVTLSHFSRNKLPFAMILFHIYGRCTCVCVCVFLLNWAIKFFHTIAGLKIVTSLLGGGASNDGIDKVDNGGSPIQVCYHISIVSNLTNGFCR